MERTLEGNCADVGKVSPLLLLHKLADRLNFDVVSLAETSLA